MINDLKQYGDIEEHASLKNLNTYRIPGQAKYLISPNSINDLISILKYLKEKKIKYFILGGGSNIILNDREYDGAIIRLNKLNGIEFHPDLEMAYAEAGAILAKIAKE
jgi:UDP-N-acetylmuramate dehydrogenase